MSHTSGGSAAGGAAAAMPQSKQLRLLYQHTPWKMLTPGLLLLDFTVGVGKIYRPSARSSSSEQLPERP